MQNLSADLSIASANTNPSPEQPREQKAAQVTAIIVEKLKETLTAQYANNQHKLVVTGQDSCPVELVQGPSIQSQDLINYYEEADVIVVSQAIYAASVEGKTVSILADDTDILFCYCTITRNNN